MALRVGEIELMLATPAPAFSREGWVFELKYDGFRVLAGLEGGRAVLRYRGGSEATAVFPEVAQAVEGLGREHLVLDGELVVLEPDGRPSFERLQQRFSARGGASAAVRAAHPVTYFAFDLLALDGRDLRGEPLLERKQLLRSVLRPGDGVQYVDHIEASGDAFFAEVRRRQLEGIVAKRATSTYVGGRSRNWLKVPVHQTANVMVVGFTVPGAVRIGGLHVARRMGKTLVYAGKVGFGFAGRALGAIRDELARIACGAPACVGAPRGSAHVWVQPTVVCAVRYKEITSAGILRQPVFVRFEPNGDVDQAESKALSTRRTVAKPSQAPERRRRRR